MQKGKVKFNLKANEKELSLFKTHGIVLILKIH